MQFARSMLRRVAAYRYPGRTLRFTQIVKRNRSYERFGIISQRRRLSIVGERYCWIQVFDFDSYGELIANLFSTLSFGFFTRVPVTGGMESGNMVAIMGPSGAGKTTLLAALSRRTKFSSGYIRINGCSVSESTMLKIAGYVPQYDIFPHELTAMEYMIFTCALRLDRRTSAKVRNVKAIKIFEELGLRESSDTLISQLSGGQTKRLSLAVEMVAEPKILFLDEPTTGLDSCTAMRVIELVKAQARSGTLVFCTIHQPSMDVYKMFSHVILLANGRTIYDGTINNVESFFNGQGFHLPESFNEAEYYVKVITDSDSARSLYATRITSSTPRKISSCNETVDFHSPGTSKPNQLVQFWWLIWRICLQNRRSMFHDTTHHFTFLVSAVLVGLFYLDVDSKTQRGIQDIRGALYLVTSEVIFTTAYSVVYEIPSIMPLYLRENLLYKPEAYYAATVIGSIPGALLQASVFLGVVFLAVDGERDPLIFLQLGFCIAMAAITANAYGTSISSCIQKPNVATAIMIPIDLCSLLMAGIFYNIGMMAGGEFGLAIAKVTWVRCFRSMPSYIAWLRYISIFYYTNEALAITHWSNVALIECYPDEDLPCFKNGHEVLTDQGYKESNLWLDIGGLLALTLTMHIAGYLGVRRRRAVRSIY